MSADQTIRDYYFVFGTRYAEELHPVFSTTSLPRHYVTVEAPDEETARGIMTAICGTQWSRCLTSIPDGYFKLGELTRYRWGGAKPDLQPSSNPITDPVSHADYGHTVTIGNHKVTSWPARVEDAALIHDAAVRIEFRGVQVMVYASTADGRTVVETALTDEASQYRVVADGTDPVYVNYLHRSED